MRSGSWKRRPAIGAIAAVAAIALATCSAEDPEKEFEEASAAAEAARVELEEAKAQVEEERERVQAAQVDLDAAESTRREVELRLAEAESRVARAATDDVLFGAVQRRLHEDADLEDVAISARVQRGVVTLDGVVAAAELRDRAVEIARNTPGVSRVESRIQVPVAPASAQAD